MVLKEIRHHLWNVNANSHVIHLNFLVHRQQLLSMSVSLVRKFSSEPSESRLTYVDTLPDCADAPPWAATEPIAGRVILPLGRGSHAFEPLVRKLCNALNERILELHLQQIVPKFGARLVVWHLSPCTALALSIAARRLQISLVWLNDRWSNAEAARAFRISGAHALVTGQTSVPLFAQSNVPVLGTKPLPETSVTTIWAGVVSRGPLSSRVSDEFVFFTSGTGGIARGARLSHSAMDVQAAEKVSRLPFRCGTSYLHLAPHFHVAGASSALAALRTGCDHVFFSAEGGVIAHAAEVFALICGKRIGILVVVPTVLRAIVDAAISRNVTCSTVVCILYGGGRAGAALRRAANTVFPRANVVGAYGMTEAASSMTFVEHSKFPLDDPHHESAGLVPSHVQLAVRTATGECGPVLTRGSHLMRGYCGEIEIDPRDWFETGDLGIVVSGALVIVGRMRDVIRTGGESVFAREVEDALEMHTGVRESAVVGVPHRLLGEAVAAAVVVEGEEESETSALLQWCRERLSAYKVPKWIFQVDGLPTNALGKVVKPVLKVELEKRLSLGRVGRMTRAKL